MRLYYVAVPSFSTAYASAQRYVIALANDERIVGVYRWHRPVVVVAPRGSLHYTRGVMPQFYPDEWGGKQLSVYNWRHTGVSQYAAGEAADQDGVLWSQDCRAPDPLICRTRRVLSASSSHPFDSAWEWAVAPIEDLDPALTAREAALAAPFLQFQE